jgi:glucokinase
MILPFHSTARKKNPGEKIHVLAGDLGGTKTNLAYYSWEETGIIKIRGMQYKSQDFQHISEILGQFMEGLPMPGSVCLAVAGPVMNGMATLTNLNWQIDQHELSRHFRIPKVSLINDLEANAYGIALLDEKDFALIHNVSNITEGNAAIIAPGTGLGEAGLYWDGKYYHPFGSEGGHSDFSPRNESDIELLRYLQKKFGHVSWERLVCGPGILNIYQFLRDEKNFEVQDWLLEKMKDHDNSTIISQHTETSEICNETMARFIRFLAQESANLVLKLKATSGLFIGGGIVPQMVPLFTKYNFNSSYCKSGRLNYLLEKVPIRIILNNKTALLGAAFYGHEHYHHD